MKRRYVALAGAAGLMIVGGGLAAASIPSADGTITSCFVNQSGTLRVVDSATQCRNTETALTWNQQGVAGPAGPQGDQGEQGPAGPPGTSGDEVFYATDFVIRAELSKTGHLLSLAIPNGAYRVDARVEVSNFRSGNAAHPSCSIKMSNGVEFAAVERTLPLPEGEPWVTEVFEFSGALNKTFGDNITLSCAGGGADGLFAEQPTLTATKVATVNGEPAGEPAP